ncbi:MAG: glycogen synthase GlgA [Propionivibrio sp.]|uniref:Glycogen synthase n=1 Tax=Candidatus Propionivibrio dominans TaxID=2954373 RepID=A0A9D7FCB1_9RHOO|nr:glycogen synthase GlgA [Candidatus Propionivibrio dominans]
MRILHVASEIYPLVKAGGLADVIASLPAALAKRGLDVRVLLPGFPGILNGMLGLKPVIRIGPAFGAAVITIYIGSLPDSGLLAYVIDAPFLYQRQGNIYVGFDGFEWSDNHRRFGLLGWVAAHVASGELDPDWRPDVVHAHDWHAGLAPIYMAQNPGLKTASVFTIHNLAYQGIFPMDCLADLGLPMRQLTPHGIEFHGMISFMKAALVYSKKITTVSPTYAREIRTPEFGCGLDGVLRDRAGDLSGILNGVDPEIWNPEDPDIARPYSADNLKGKMACKLALQSELGLSNQAEGPLFAVVSRLFSQKGMDLLLAALPDLLREGAQLAVLGTGEDYLEEGFRHAAAANPEKVAAFVGYDEAMAHRFFAGADVLLVPSRFEPCGLTQLYALRYGTLPLVHRVGGLADTVIDATPGNLQSDSATGFVFDDVDRQAISDSIHEACTLYRDQIAWHQVQRRAMEQDFSWDDSAAHYEALYRSL